MGGNGLKAEAVVSGVPHTSVLCQQGQGQLWQDLSVIVVEGG